MTLIDISWTISEGMTVYKDKPEKKTRIASTKQYEKDGVNESRIEIDSHTGTHVDAPKHFLKEGKGIDEVLPITGKCKVLDFSGIREKITVHELATAVIEKGDIVLLKTLNSSLPESGPFKKDFVFLDKTGASYLAEKGIRAVGIDYLGIERDQPEHETHKTLLEHGIIIIEGLRLAHVAPGEYKLVCLPLKIKDCDAGLARAILIEH